MLGKRRTYANPIRLYLVISLVHFFILSFVYTGSEDAEDDSSIIKFTSTADDNLNFSFGDSIEGNEVIPDSVVQKSIVENSADSGEATFIRELLIINSMADLPGNGVKEIADSIRVDEMTPTRGYLMKQLIKLQLSKDESIVEYLIQNIPILMFFLLPVYALILKLFLRRRLYIEHLIHSIHLHSFLFFLLSFVWIWAIIQGFTPGFLKLLIVAFLITYVIVSIRKVYKVKWLRATILILGIGLTYSFALSIGILLEIIISLLTY
jgi:hypothetical protein